MSPDILSSNRRGAVGGADQLSLLTEPTRFAIYAFVAWHGAQTIRDVAERLGMRPASLYRHFDQLVEAGLLIEQDQVPTTRRPASRFAAHPDPSLVYRPNDPEAVEALNRVVDRSARHAAAGFRVATAAGKAITSGQARNTHMGMHGGWLTPRELVRANELLNELRELFMSGARRPGTTLLELTVFLAPRSAKES